MKLTSTAVAILTVLLLVSCRPKEPGPQEQQPQPPQQRDAGAWVRAGTVQEVQIFTTILSTPDNKRIIVPNSQIMDGIITNVSANDNRRVDLVVGCSYDDDIDKVYKVLNEILEQIEVPKEFIGKR